MRGGAVDASPHLDGAVGGGGEDAAVHLVDGHGVDGPVVGDERVHARAVRQLPRLDGVVVGPGVQQARHGVQHQARDGVAVLVLRPPLQLIQQRLGRQGRGFLGPDVVAHGGGADGPDAHVVVAAVGGDQCPAAGCQRRDAAAADVEVAAVEAARRGPGPNAAAVGGREEDAALHGQRVHVALEAVQRRQAVVDGRRGRRKRTRPCSGDCTHGEHPPPPPPPAMPMEGKGISATPPPIEGMMGTEDMLRRPGSTAASRAGDRPPAPAA